ncbi:hypothetical protein D3C87_1066590 [compost metagenome]
MTKGRDDSKPVRFWSMTRNCMNIVHVGKDDRPVESRRFFRIRDQGHVVSLRHQHIVVVFKLGRSGAKSGDFLCHFIQP